MKNILAFLGRLLLASIFLLSAVQKFLHWEVSYQYFTTSLSSWQGYMLQHSVNFPRGVEMFDALLSWSPLLLLLGACVEVLGAVLVIFGVAPRLGALLLALFLLPATVIFHPFWMVEGEAQMLQVAMFLKNVSILGGLLLLMGYGGGSKAAPSKPSPKE